MKDDPITSDCWKRSYHTCKVKVGHNTRINASARLQWARESFVTFQFENYEPYRAANTISYTHSPGNEVLLHQCYEVQPVSVCVCPTNHGVPTGNHLPEFIKGNLKLRT